MPSYIDAEPNVLILDNTTTKECKLLAKFLRVIITWRNIGGRTMYRLIAGRGL